MSYNVRASGSQSFPVSESDIRGNFNNTQQVIGGANRNVAAGGGQLQFYSADGGLTWAQTSLALSSGDDFHSDPCVDWTSDGTAWALTIGFDSAQTHLRIRAFKSTDAGASWSEDGIVSGTQTEADRETMHVDHSPTSGFKDTIYATWHAGNDAFLGRRTSAGWQTPFKLTGAETTGEAIGGDVTTNANGEVFVFWPDNGGTQKLFVRKSTDGGASFAPPVPIATAFGLGSFELTVPADASRGILTYVTAGAFRTATKDLVYAAWTDLTGEAGCTSSANMPGTDSTSTCKTRIWFSRSTDGGTTWSVPVMINNHPSKNDQFNPRLAVDDATGQVAIIYYDTVADPGRKKTNLWLQMSADDGSTWSTASRVTDAETDETVDGADVSGSSAEVFGDQYGDYNGITGLNGVFVPCWTDRRSGGREEIWTALVRTTRDCFFIVQKSTFGEDEVNAILGQPPAPAVVPDCFWVAVEGYSPADLGLSTGNLGNPPIKPGINITPSVSGLSFVCTGVTPEDLSLPPTLQRMRFAFAAVWTDSTAFGFTGDFEDVTLSASFTARGSTVTGQAQLRLTKQADPYVLNGATSWLSIDLRVFQITAGASRFGIQVPDTGNARSDATSFIQQVTDALTSGQGSTGGQTFEFDLPQDEEAPESIIELAPDDANGKPVFNFGIARVRLRGLTEDAKHVRAFFRLFQAQTTSAAFDLNTTYRRWSDGLPAGRTVPLPGVQKGEYVTVPCFAEPRVDATSQALTDQHDDHNVRDIAVDPSGAEVQAFFGCWLDTNQPSAGILPQSPDPSNLDGPFGGTLLSLEQVIIRSLHQCLIAEIAFDPIAIPFGADPSTSDKLAQRNLAFGPVPNPGVQVGSRRVPQPFELRATAPSIIALGGRQDELMLDWGGLPVGTKGQIFLPEIDADDVIRSCIQAALFRLPVKIDANTLELSATGGVSYIPIPEATDKNFTGLVTVDLPQGIRKGQQFDALVRQVTTTSARRQPPPPPPPQLETARASRPAAFEPGASNDRLVWRRVNGSFQLRIPVRTKDVLLLREERLYSILQWIRETIPANSRWWRVFDRYVSQIRGRVAGFGADPGKIPPTPDGNFGRPHPKPGPRDGEHRLSYVGKIVGVSYDQFGDFEGFLLQVEDAIHNLHTTEHRMERLALKAWRRRIRVKVIVEAHNRHAPMSLVYLRAPEPYQD
ncbi:hypothetical protein [Paraburkholderia sp. EG304]|uniref:hypothetical protein n=1 Tax=Paraburkholderia sp. EG304 TaxID=3237015 RepID=UPI00397C2ED2